jgi:hypothetical protein
MPIFSLNQLPKRKIRKSISFHDFAKLKRGDIVLFGNKKKPRIVLYGMGNDGKKFIHFAFLSPVSWRLRFGRKNCADTTYIWQDMKNKLRLPQSKINLLELRKIEKERIKSFGIDIKEAFRFILKHSSHLPKCETPSRSLWPKKKFVTKHSPHH